MRVRYTTFEIGDMDIHLKMLKDTMQFCDPDHIAENLGISSATWPIFGVVWPAGEVLAHLMGTYQVKGKHILEMGCGIALASLVLNSRRADITATDRHPAAEGFLDYNTGLNKGDHIPFVRTGWADLGDDGLGRFDLLIGSDLLYEAEHVELLSHFINRHAKPHCQIVIVDPGRGYHAKFSKTMTRLGYGCTQEKPVQTEYLKDRFKGRILTYSR